MAALTISVVTISFNNLNELKETCASVDAQTAKPFEHIIIDGSTSSDIKDWLRDTDLPSYRIWISEKDNGIADAFNKGIRKSKGDLIVMLNSGDSFYSPAALETVLETFEAHPEVQWIHGKYELVRGGQSVIIGKPYEKSKLYRGMRSISHQTMFVRKELYSKYGLYDTNEKIGMDYDFLCRIANEPFAFVENPLVKFAPGGISSSSYLKALKDAKRIYQKHYGNSVMLTVWQTRLKTLHYLLHSPIGKFLYTIKKKLGLENI